MGVYAKLLKVQTSLKAPKGQYNDFGKYAYRSCEDILEGVKPFLKEVNALVLLTDDVVLIGDRFYVKATATFIDCETGEQLENNAFAREELSKKGMDASQVTGTSSSYARKYALNGLFAIDDTKDADTNEHKKQQNAVDERLKPVIDELKRIGFGAQSVCKKYQINSIEEMTDENIANFLKNAKDLPTKEA